jgi:23S rRNA (pseudouridine1915-N3)-methyltransferase
VQILIIAAGKLKSGPELSLTQTYIKRCPWPVKITEIEERRPIKGAERMTREGELLLKAIPQGAYVIALDERGKKLRSPEFAKKIETIADNGIRTLVFMIGGADGYDPSVKKRADMLISLGSMTWPHMMVRAMIAEQIYRASTILSNHPYHKD